MGSFSGSALTEALKTLVLLGRWVDQDGKSHYYEKVEVDGMSGASAGAIALAIMLKSMTHYRKVWSDLGEYIKKERSDLAARYACTLEDLEKDLRNQFGIDIVDERTEEFQNEIGEQLLALEVCQRIQEWIWVEELDAARMFDPKIKEKADPYEPFSLLARSGLQGIVDQLMFETIGEPGQHQVLSDRVLFACSLTSMLPFSLNRSKGSGLVEAYRRSTVSYTHRDLRVIDFQFKEVDESDQDHAWLKFTHDMDAAKPGAHDKSSMVFSLQEKESWAILSASAFACGAFPVAFDPVVLKRFRLCLEGCCV